MTAHIQGDAASGNGWVVSSRWHIDDVKYAIKDSEYADKPMPSDEDLLEYLKDVIGNEYWVGEMNRVLAEELDDLFEDKD
jgi:acetyltransferase-like isoleucine patch superfamily enzyme